MASQNYLFRGGEKIELEKEPEFFTAIIPEPNIVEEMQRTEPVQEVKHVFYNVYKVRTPESDRDDIMQRFRTDERSPGVCHHAYNPVGDKSTRYYITDHLIVAFKSGVARTRIEEILERHGLRFVRDFKYVEEFTCLLQVTKSAGKNPVKVSEDLQEVPEITFAEPNLVNRFEHVYQPSDTLYDRQWHLKSTMGIELSPDANIAAPSAWNTTRGSRNIVVAVIDDGFDLTHPDLNGPSKIVFPRDFVDLDDAPLPGRFDFHGTPCAGLAIGEEDGAGIVGVAPGCSFMPIRFGLTADDELLYEMFEYTGRRADIISNSWGPVPVYAPIPMLLQRQLKDLRENGGPRGKGCLIFFAAGNYNAPLKATGVDSFVWRHPTQGLKETRGAILNGHAANPNVVAVSASTSQNKKAAYSNWGDAVNVCAPSNNAHPLDPQIRQPGQGIWTADNNNFGRRFTGEFGGTSAACPIAAGVAALVWSANPDLTAGQVQDILEETADKIVDTSPDPVLGLRKGTYDENGHSEWFGFGKVNATKAVEKARSLKGDNGGDTEPEQPPFPTEGISIIAAMVNPEGSDRGNEMLALFNETDEAMDVSGWEIRNKRGDSDRITELVINPGFTNIVFLNEVRLSNFGGEISLYNPDGVEVDKVSYNFIEGLRSGWWIRF